MFLDNDRRNEHRHRNHNLHQLLLQRMLVMVVFVLMMMFVLITFMTMTLLIAYCMFSIALFHNSKLLRFIHSKPPTPLCGEIRWQKYRIISATELQFSVAETLRQSLLLFDAANAVAEPRIIQHFQNVFTMMTEEKYLY